LERLLPLRRRWGFSLPATHSPDQFRAGDGGGASPSRGHDGNGNREPRYHLHIEQPPEWADRGETLSPLKGYPGVMWERPVRKKQVQEIPSEGM
jgi:hypothetical protein